MIRIYIGTNPDGSDERPAAVLRHSILSNTDADVEFVALGDGSGGTGFSEARYSIPTICDESYAIYLDADMLVLGDIRDLWSERMPMRWMSSETYPKGSSAVSVISCRIKMPWPINIKPYWYDQQLFEAGILWPTISRRWNCRDCWKVDYTQLIHYTDRSKQPWNHEPSRTIDTMWLAYEERMNA